MKRYLKLNDINWRKLCKKQLKYEQQKFKIDDKKQIEFNIEKKEQCKEILTAEEIENITSATLKAVERIRS